MEYGLVIRAQEFVALGGLIIRAQEFVALRSAPCEVPFGTPLSPSLGRLLLHPD